MTIHLLLEVVLKSSYAYSVKIDKKRNEVGERKGETDRGTQIINNVNVSSSLICKVHESCRKLLVLLSNYKVMRGYLKKKKKKQKREDERFY